MKNIELEAERLTLKVLGSSYARPVLDYFVRNKGFLEPWEPLRDDCFYSLEFQKEQLIMDLRKMREDRMFKVWIFEKDGGDPDRVIGSVSLNEIVRGCFHSCFLGYRLDGQKVNRGYMTEAVRAVVDYGFNSLALHRVEANIIPRNKASLRVVEKLGFADEGLAKKYLKIHGRWEDHVHMVLLNEKWNNL